MSGKKWSWFMPLMMIIVFLLGACTPAVQTVVVEKTVQVKETVQVEKEVIKEVTKVVQGESIVVTATPVPKAPWLTLGSTWNAPPAYNGNRFAPGSIGPAWWWIFEPPFHYVPISGDVLPRLADSFEDTEKAFTLHLTKNVKWHDGTPFTSKDVKCTYDLRKLQSAGFWNYITEVQTPDDNTVVMPWKERSNFFVQMLAAEPITSPCSLYGKWADQVAGTGDDKQKMADLLADMQKFRPEKPIGTGPFFVQTVTASDIVMPKFKDYRLADKVAFEGVKYLLTATHEVGMAYALNGDIHGCGAPARADFEAALKARRPDLRIISITDLSEFGVMFNTRKAPLNDIRVRQALSQAVDRQQMTEAGFPMGAAIKKYDTQVLQSMESAWINPDVTSKMTSHEFDVAKAEALLKDAGFKKDAKGQWLLPNGQVWKLTFSAPACYGDWVLGGENLAAQWQKFGIAAEFQPQDCGVYWNNVDAGQIDVGLVWAGVFWSTAHPYTAFDWFFRGSTAKETGLDIKKGPFKGPDGKDVDVDALLTELGATKDQARTKEIVSILAYVANESMVEMVWVEKQFQFCVFDKEVTGYPKTEDPLWMLAPGGMERVWVWLMINGTIKPE